MGKSRKRQRAECGRVDRGDGNKGAESGVEGAGAGVGGGAGLRGREAGLEGAGSRERERGREVFTNL